MGLHYPAGVGRAFGLRVWGFGDEGLGLSCFVFFRVQGLE